AGCRCGRAPRSTTGRSPAGSGSSPCPSRKRERRPGRVPSLTLPARTRRTRAPGSVSGSLLPLQHEDGGVLALAGDELGRPGVALDGGADRQLVALELVDPAVDRLVLGDDVDLRRVGAGVDGEGRRPLLVAVGDQLTAAELPGTIL